MKVSVLIGNGINRSFGNDCKSLDDLLKEMLPDDLSDEQKTEIPFPLKIVLGTKNNVADKMKEWSGYLWGEISDQEQLEFYQRLLRLPADDILTANYGFELEEVARGIMNHPMTSSMVSSITDHTDYKGCRRNEGSMFLHTYQKCIVNDQEKRVWHIHGHAKNPSSMIIGHYYYGNMLCKIKSYLVEIGPRYKFLEAEGEKEQRVNSWVDAFIMNDVYVLGFGYDFAEMDLWWLLERKNCEKATHGKLYFYEPGTEYNEVKHKLLEIYGAEVKTLGYRIEDGDPEKERKYKEFYYSAIEDMEKDIIKTQDL